MSERKRLLHSRVEVEKRITQLASEITARHSDNETGVWDDPLIVTVLPGAAQFGVLLAREIAHQGRGTGEATDENSEAEGIHPNVTYMTTSRRTDSATPNAEMQILSDIVPEAMEKINGPGGALIVDSIFDMGITAETLRRHLIAMGARSVELAVLVARDMPRSTTIKPDYVGFNVPDVWLFGMGLADKHEEHRWLDGIYAVTPEENQFQHAVLSS